jgi:hypothetical protein
MTTTLPTAPRHALLAAGRWGELTLIEQLANIGSEFGRAARAKESENDARFAAALDRCLELFDLTLADERWHGRRREIARARELVCDLLVGKNERRSTTQGIDAYFLTFARTAGLGRSRPPGLFMGPKYGSRTV